MKQLLLVLILACTGCAEKKAVRVVIPAECSHLTITDFTKPCKATGPDSMLCDGVVVHIACVKYQK